MKTLTISALLFLSLLRNAYSTECEPNNLGGNFCIQDNGSTTDSMPNEIGGQDVYSSNGKLTSATPKERQDDGLPTLYNSSSNLSSNSMNSGHSLKSMASAGKDWSASVNSVNDNDGAATSSMDLLDK
ncbi:RND transporter [Raoultella terrigena]|uniref:RND transporter n=1 Tax=Raoultella terrigena TaxID=577 RepID=UPI00349F0E42